MAIPGGPKFEPLFRDLDIATRTGTSSTTSTSSSFAANPHRVQGGVPVPVQQPATRGALAAYHYPQVLYIKTEDPDLPRSTTTRSSTRSPSTSGMEASRDDQSMMRRGARSLSCPRRGAASQRRPLYTDNTAAGHRAALGAAAVQHRAPDTSGAHWTCRSSTAGSTSTAPRQPGQGARVATKSCSSAWCSTSCTSVRRRH